MTRFKKDGSVLGGHRAFFKGEVYDEKMLFYLGSSKLF